MGPAIAPAVLLGIGGALAAGAGGGDRNAALTGFGLGTLGGLGGFGGTAGAGATGAGAGHLVASPTATSLLGLSTQPGFMDKILAGAGEHLPTAVTGMSLLDQLMGGAPIPPTVYQPQFQQGSPFSYPPVSPFMLPPGLLF